MTVVPIRPSRLPAPDEARRRLMQAGAAMLAAPALLSACATAGGDANVVQTTAGPVRGLRSGAVAVFKGVPYAASTAGPGRFMPPRPPLAWTEVRDATAYGPSSPGLGYPPFLMKEEGVDLGLTPPSEESLVLNVWTARPGKGAKQPVMVWLHGGGFVSGSGGSPRYDGTRLAERQGVVVVTVNHRLGALGFMDLTGFGDARFDRSVNLGLQDIVRSLEWVRDNIAAFGGDAGNVTVFGESGGGTKVSTLMAMPSARGLFHRAIAESGTALRIATPEDARRSAQAVLGKLGVAPDRLDGLAALPFDKITAATPGNIGPVADGRIVPRHPFDPDAPAISAQVPLLIGSNLSEATFFNDTPLEPIDDASLAARVGKYTALDAAKCERLIALYKSHRPGAPNHILYQTVATDWWLTADVHLEAQRKAAQGAAPVFVYQFAMPQGARGGALNVPHTAEIAYVFDNLKLSSALVGDATPARQLLADQVSAAWCEFARKGDPNGRGLPQWRPYTAASPTVMVLDAAPHPAPAWLADEQAAVNALRRA